MEIKIFISVLSASFIIGVLSQPAMAMDSCLVGNWKADKAQLQKFFTQSSSQVFSNPSGDIRMSLKSNGKGQYQMNNLKLVSNPRDNSEPKVSMSMNGLY